MRNLIKRNLMQAATDLYGDCATPLQALKYEVRDELECSNGVVGDPYSVYNQVLSEFNEVLEEIEEDNIQVLQKLYIKYLDRFNDLHYAMLEEVKTVDFVQYVRTLYDIQNALFDLLQILEEN